MTTRITGHTRLAGIVGMPVAHSLSPAMHNAAYEALSLDWIYVALPLADEAALYRFASAARVMPFVGFNVTMPFKETILSQCDEVAMLAQMAGAVNTVHCVDGRLIGYNTDGRGLLESLAADAGFDPAGKRVAVVGAGGAGGSAVVSLILAKASKVSLVNRSAERAEQVVERVHSHARNTELEAVSLEAAEEIVSSAELVVNATPVGMRPDDPSPVPVEWLQAGQVVFDMVYRPSATALVQAARAAGAHAFDGLGMLVAQGAIALDIWSESTDTRAPRDVMRAAAEERSEHNSLASEMG